MDVKKLFSLEGRKGFITGAAQGIGECLAGAFSELGAEVAIVDVNFEKAKAAAAKISGKTRGKVLAYGCDVTKPESVDTMLDSFTADFGRLDFAVNNAGICAMDPALEISPQTYESVIDVNLNGVFYTARAAAKQMVKQGQGGSIISTASMSAHIINQPQTIAAYCASKAGVVSLTKGLAVELSKYHLRVNCVSPGYIQTDLVASLKDMLGIWVSKMPEGARLGFPEDLIGAYVFLASDASAWATGSDVVVDGGYTIL
ncbi:MAG: SDR family oxidoreductase [Spirochaetaceae bacterium]|jgi:NAD(P)-dependent dehydrogenase (short-subunit alcohol dehydrogenase family)|nr:SDR family oxidoreductase [Spirochaetaceae bacterium]